MNPLGWKREHQLAGFLICVLGAAAGMLLAWFQTPFAHDQQATQIFLMWLPNVRWYWPWPVVGMTIAGLTFYVVQLLRASN